MFTGLKKFIKELQRSDEERKKRWLIGLSATTMILIVSLWISYASLTIKSLSEPNPSAKNREQAFWPVFKKGAAIIYSNIAQFVSEAVSETRQITIPGKNHTFQREGSQKIQPREIK